MRKLALALGAISVLAGGTAASGAPEARALPFGPTAGGFASDNVEHLSHIPLNVDSAGAALVGKYFYITSSNGLTIYDVSDPTAPQRLGFLALAQQPYFAEEDVDTNGRILLISSFTGLNVIDVEDKSNPTVIGQVAGADEHTYECVLDCTWAYGSEGAIVDLRDPARPELVGDWTEGLNVQSTHDVTEVKPGFVLTSTQPMFLLDARSPDKPKVSVTGASADGRFLHSNLWPRGMKDRFLLVGGESTGPSCDEEDGAFMTWSTANWQETRTFEMVDEFRVQNGIPTEGDAAADLYCTHWFTTRPGYVNGGLVAMGWYEHGTRFLKVSSKGQISEVGWFVPFAGSTSAAYWITKDILYAVDYNRGIDILRFTD